MTTVKSNINTAELWAVFKETFITFPLFVLSHPFKAFDELKTLKRGSTKFVIAAVFLQVLVSIFQATSLSFMATGFYNPNPFVMPFWLALFIVAPMLLICAANWSITSITEGKGTFKEIIQVYAYARYPGIFLILIGVLLSNIVTLNELAFVGFFFTFGTVIFYGYLFVGWLIIHEYTFARAVVMVIMTVIAMMIIVFILALTVSLVGELFGFGFTLVDEIIRQMLI
ncbi:MAG: hypothetical protein FWG68_00560 [Defluviitaleaceae bacterium]|nr:hypothetical protein [Defluviitaleaceae bacterium]